jgi:squalene synthase HpnC
VVSHDAALARAYAYCEQLARQHYENFPVASRLLPVAMRPHVAAIYAFARTADDYADEPGLAPGERLRLLDAWGARLARSATRGGTEVPPYGFGELQFGVPRGGTEVPPYGFGVPPDPVFLALGQTIRDCRLPVALFEDLLSAFRQDVTTTRYQTWAGVLDYCRRSANPVGRLVLRVAGYDDARLDQQSDAVCTALQLANFWQDVGRDWAIGRLYVPGDDRLPAGAREEDLTASRMTTEWRSVMRVMVRRTRELFAAGRGVCDGVGGRLRWELRLTWLGGMRILDAIEHADYDVFNHRPTIGKRDIPGLIRDAVLWR